MAPYYPWGYWTDGTGSVTSATDTIWPSWTAACNHTTTIWLSWTSNQTALTPVQAPVQVMYAPPPVQPPPPTPEELAQREAQWQRERAEHERQMTAHLERVRVAKQQAEALLLSLLDDVQREQLQSDGDFHVQTRDGERVYRLGPNRQPMRIKGEDGQSYSYCIHPIENYPAEDTVVAQKLLLESDEEAFLSIANATLVRHA